MTKTLFTTMAALQLLMPCAAAWAQAYPVKPIRILSQFGAGAPGDILMRFTATRMAEVLGQPVVVETRNGANGVVAAGAGARAVADGYTLIGLGAGVPVVQVVAGRELPFNPVKDLTPISLVGNVTSVIVVGAASSSASLKDLLDQAKSNPEKITYGTTGIGSQHHLAGEQIRMLAGAGWVHIPYKLAPLPDAASGAVTAAFTIAPQAMPMIKAGKLRVLAVLLDARMASLPDIPVVAEIVPGFEVPPSWAGLFGPAGLPPPLARRVNEALWAALNTPEARARVESIGYELGLNKSPDDYSAMLRRQIELIGRIVKAAKITLAD
ncbi:MAG: Bug family tripartite tricarboxylate transporter substrate binding protein [Burkholderiales bacterium]